MKKLTDYIDQEGFIVHLDPDESSGGDSCQRTFMYFISLIARGSIPIDVPALESYWLALQKDGEPRRHWDERYWPGRAGYMSRDNLIPAVCFLTLIGSNLVYKLLIDILVRFGFLWNKFRIGQHDGKAKIPDFCGPMIWLISLRWTRAAAKYMRIVLWFHLRKVKKDPEDTSDDLNIQVLLMTLHLLAPNQIKPVLEYYAKNRPKVPSLGKFDPNLGFAQSFIQYFKPDISPPLDKEWISAIQSQWKFLL